MEESTDIDMNRVYRARLALISGHLFYLCKEHDKLKAANAVMREALLIISKDTRALVHSYRKMAEKALLSGDNPPTQEK